MEHDFKAWLVSVARDIMNGDTSVVERAESILEMFDDENEEEN